MRFGWSGLILSAALAVSAPRLAAGQRPADGAAPLRVLFIGNSYTYFHNAPELLASLAAGARPARRIEVEMVVAGGASLADHWGWGRALERLEARRWDVVVLQEQSMLGITLVEGRPGINAPAGFARAAQLFDRVIRRAGARTVLFGTWSRRGTPPEHQAALDAAYAEFARRTGARVAPVGRAWDALRAEGVDLYEPDGTHPSAAGSYVVAAVLWGTLTGRSAVGLPRSARGYEVADLGTGDGRRSTPSVLAALDSAQALRLQRAADVAVRGERAFVASTPAPGGSVPRLTLPDGPRRSLSPTALAGAWRGTLALFDAPAEVMLVLAAEGDSLAGWWEERYAGGEGGWRGRAQELSWRGDTLAFVLRDPRFLAPPVMLHAVLRGDSLTGIAEVGSATQVPHLIGRWRLTR